MIFIQAGQYAWEWDDRVDAQRAKLERAEMDRRRLERTLAKTSPDNAELVDMHRQRLDDAAVSVDMQKSGLAAKLSERDPTYRGWQLVSLGTIRLGAVALVIFLVQILSTVYRYNRRMGAFYQSRADALKLQHETGERHQLAELVALLNTDRLTFGKEEPSPVEHVAELAKEAIRGASTKRSAE